MSETRTPGAAPPRILLGVTGGIAAYKSAELARTLVKRGAQVQVVMTAAAKRFVGPTTFQALTGHPVRDELWDPQAEAAMGHIELARWPDAILIAPASADFLARLATGLADDLLTTLCLASDKPMFAAPAMNRLMWANPATQDNLARLRARGLRVLGPDSGAQACGESGEGRMSEPESIADEVLAACSGPRPLHGVTAVVTAGPTREPIDPVRFIGNRSSGKQGYALAQALAELGTTVTLVSGPTGLEPPAGVRRVAVETAQQMLDATLAALPGAELLVGAAAVADYRPEAPAPQKIKKNAATLELRLTRNPDILAEARARFPDLFIVGFAAETEQLAQHAQDKLTRKKLDLVAANWVGDGQAFETEDNALHVYWKNAGERKLGPGPKLAVARELASLIAQRLREKKSASVGSR
ncbi:MAG: bifunctional phosphopantothenoylcysteine decarboxylase/phosphopantothenate--cysteine ligase CoaBC [Nevskia sp.]|nr:bifunctional phosphopantothenoylcysteine decarboxylase/phosphopantothenate--cysteine ligase CoaBC [Nevskia sp.]